MRSLMMTIFVALLVTAKADAGVNESIEGVALRLPERTEVYRERHEIAGNEHQVHYRRGDGTLFAENRLDYSHNNSAPTWLQRDLRDGSSIGGGWQDGAYVLRRNAETANVPHSERLVASAGFDRFVRRYWRQLRRGEALVFEFAVPARLATYAMRIRPHAPDARFPEVTAWFHVQPANALLRLFAQPTLLGYDAHGRLRVYRGLSNLNDDDGNPLVVEIRYSAAVGDRESPPQSPERG